MYYYIARTAFARFPEIIHGEKENENLLERDRLMKAEVEQLAKESKANQATVANVRHEWDQSPTDMGGCWTAVFLFSYVCPGVLLLVGKWMSWLVRSGSASTGTGKVEIWRNMLSKLVEDLQSPLFTPSQTLATHRHLLL